MKCVITGCNNEKAENHKYMCEMHVQLGDQIMGYLKQKIEEIKF